MSPCTEQDTNAPSVVQFPMLTVPMVAAFPLAASAPAIPTPASNAAVPVISAIRFIGKSPFFSRPDGALRQELGDPRVYLIQGGQKRWVVNQATLQLIQETTGRIVRPVAAGGLGSVATGPYIAALDVTTTPHPPVLDIPVEITVSAADPLTQAAVAGEVFIAGAQVGTTGTPFSYTFTDYPQGEVVATGYVPTPIDFGFPPPPVVPNVIGDTTSDALKAIRAAGLVTSVHSRIDATCENIGEVISQSPDGGTRSQPGAVVTIWVGATPPHGCP